MVTKFHFFEINQMSFLVYVYSVERDAQFTLSEILRVKFNWIKADLNRRYVSMI